MRILLATLLLLYISDTTSAIRKSRPRTDSRTSSVNDQPENPTVPNVPFQSESLRNGSKTQIHTGNHSEPPIQQIQPIKSNDSTANDTCQSHQAQSQEACRVAPLWINLAGKYEGLVVKSHTYVNVGRCLGACSYRRHGNRAYMRSLRAIILRKKIDENNFGGCVPTKVENSMADIRYKKKTVSYVLEGLIVKECGCIV
jgi:hypothetical protein